MNRRWVLVLALGLLAAFTVAVTALMPARQLKLLREPEVESIVWKPKASRVQQVGVDHIATALAIMERWGEEVGADHSAGRKALLALGSKWATHFLGRALRGEIEDRTGNARKQAVITCKEMGPAALPLVPDLLDLFRRSIHRGEVIEAIRAIGEMESVKEVNGWTDGLPWETPSKVKT